MYCIVIYITILGLVKVLLARMAVVEVLTEVVVFPTNDLMSDVHTSAGCSSAS
jgi:hypothetical protein